MQSGVARELDQRAAHHPVDVHLVGSDARGVQDAAAVRGAHLRGLDHGAEVAVAVVLVAGADDRRGRVVGLESVEQGGLDGDSLVAPALRVAVGVRGVVRVEEPRLSAGDPVLQQHVGHPDEVAVEVGDLDRLGLDQAPLALLPGDRVGHRGGGELVAGVDAVLAGGQLAEAGELRRLHLLEPHDLQVVVPDDAHRPFHPGDAIGEARVVAVMDGMAVAEQVERADSEAGRRIGRRRGCRRAGQPRRRRGGSVTELGRARQQCCRGREPGDGTSSRTTGSGSTRGGDGRSVKTHGGFLHRRRGKFTLVTRVTAETR